MDTQHRTAELFALLGLAVLLLGVALDSQGVIAESSWPVILALLGTFWTLSVLVLYLRDENGVPVAVAAAIYAAYTGTVSREADTGWMRYTPDSEVVADRADSMPSRPSGTGRSVNSGVSEENTGSGLARQPEPRGSKPIGVCLRDIVPELGAAEASSIRALLEGVTSQLGSELGLAEEITVSEITDDSATVDVVGCKVGRLDGFDNPILSALAVCAADHLGTEVEAAVVGSDREAVDGSVVLRWAVPAEGRAEMGSEQPSRRS